jgi:fumarate hydratase class II
MTGDRAAYVIMYWFEALLSQGWMRTNGLNFKGLFETGPTEIRATSIVPGWINPASQNRILQMGTTRVINAPKYINFATGTFNLQAFLNWK